MASALWPFGSLPRAPKHWLWPFGMCWSPAMQKKKRVNRTRSVCARCGDEVLCGAENAVFGMCANERVWTSVKLRSHALKFKGNGPLDPLWALQCRKLGVDIFFWSSWGSNASSLEIVRERHTWPTIINPTWSKGYWVLQSCGLYYYSHEFE